MELCYLNQKLPLELKGVFLFYSFEKQCLCFIHLKTYTLSFILLDYPDFVKQLNFCNNSETLSCDRVRFVVVGFDRQLTQFS